MNIRTPLASGHEIKLNGMTVVIDEAIGSCIVYNAHYFDDMYLRHRIRLKELYPKAGSCIRAQDGTVNGDIPEKITDRFCRAAHLQEKLRDLAALTNATFMLQGVAASNGTTYSVMEYLNGECMRELCISNVQEYLTLLRQIAKHISEYHKAGYLHLDIKPENVYCLKTADGYKPVLFDFDSVVRIEDIADPDVSILSSKGYDAPEISDRKKISERTDIFSLGAMLFEKVFGRTPDKLKDCSSFSRWKAAHGGI